MKTHDFYAAGRCALASLAFCAATLMGGCTPATGDDTHFMTDAAYRRQVQADFAEKTSLVGTGFCPLDSMDLGTMETEAMQFLYAYMPVADMTDYSADFYLQNVRTAFRAISEMPWGQEVPELYFRHFVLPVRVNNERLDAFRPTYYEELKQRVSGLTMAEAILEINHWCHEHVTYQPSDGRTSSPMASMRSAYGRCGEESTFTVSALRAVGIPARQVYTPRWAHTDDNHAWVEAWADGQWHFLGACEPEPVLDLGWFNSAASRAMLMHTRVFGRYDGPEEKMLESGTFTEINLIDNYAKTARIDFHIVNADGTPAAGARIDFMIYNYAEFNPVVTKYADASGSTFLTAGMGDMMVWASLDGSYGYAKASFGSDRELTLTLSRNAAADAAQRVFAAEDIDIVPPAEDYTLPAVTDEQRAANTLRFAAEDSIRQAYMDTFLDAAAADSTVRADRLPAAAAAYLVKARGNWQTVLQFLRKNAAADDGDMLRLLASLSDKDLRDVSMDVLDDNYDDRHGTVLAPRVENEELVPYKHYLRRHIPAGLADGVRADPEALVRWCQDSLTLVSGPYSERVVMSARGVWLSRVADARSRAVFFVSVLRSLGVEARRDGVTGKVQYMKDGRWNDVDFDARRQSTAPTGTLLLGYTPTPELADPEYYTHFTISRISSGTTSLLSFDSGQVDMGGGVSWSSVFRRGVTLDAGTYLLVTGRRMASGKVLAAAQVFNIAEGQTTRLELPVRSASDDVAVIGSFNSESLFAMLPDGNRVSILSQTGRGYFAVGILGVGQEPTNHVLRDIARLSARFEGWGRKMILLFTDEAQMSRFRAADYGQLPANIVYGIDTDGSVRRQIEEGMHIATGKGQLPLMVIADTFNRVVFFSQGYTIGIGEQMMQCISRL